MLKINALAAVLAASTFLTSAAFAAGDVAKPSVAAQAADKDFGKLSSDGLAAFRDIRLARLAIFDGKPSEATKEVALAQSEMAKAKTDDAVFTKAESALKPPAGMAEPGGDKAAPSSEPVRWVPIDGALTLGEDFVETPAKAAGVSKANAQLKKGDHKAALETLKLADIDVSFEMEVAPLDKTITGIEKAGQLLATGDYYQANQALKGVEDGVRFDVANANSAPTKFGAAVAKAPSAVAASGSTTAPVAR